jgi:hypothetical protein
VDLNRGWKDSAGRPLFEITSLYLSSDFRPFDKVSVRLSFDNRKNPRSLFNRSIPDSLFDDSLRRGLHTGASWNLSDRIHVDGSFGIRFREGMNNTLSAQGGVQVRDLLREKLILDARFSLFTTTLSTGYRPAVAVRLPPFGSFDVDVSMGSYIYDFGSRTSTIPWIDSTISYRANRSISLSTSLMSYLSGESRSVRVFSEMGFLF